jgi:uncharacterized DUF497 family protein
MRRVDLLDQLRACKGFDWDEGNSGKNWALHQVSDGECEQVFFNEPLAATYDSDHSEQEDRIAVLGKTDARRKLFVVCTIRGDLIRVISARDMKKLEREVSYTHG